MVKTRNQGFEIKIWSKSSDLEAKRFDFSDREFYRNFAAKEVRKTYFTKSLVIGEGGSKEE